MTIDISPLLAPVSDAAPAGDEARSSEAYETVAAEIEKLTSMSGASPVNWGLVEETGVQILSNQSKDFMLAAWVSAAWMERHGVDGLRAGLELHAGLIATFWETGFPPLKRLRGRRNALVWWTDRATAWLEANPPPPLAGEVHAAMVAAAQNIDSGLAEHDPESPPLATFVRQIKNLDVIAEPEPEAAAVSADPAPASNTAPATGSTTTAPTAPASSPPAPAHAARAPVASAPLAALPDQLATLDDVVNALYPVMDHLGHISSALTTIDRFHPLVIELNRFAARTALVSAPPANGGATALMAPPVAILDAFQSVCGAGNADGLIEFCESRILAFPFWLDLDRQSARGFGMLGEQGARMRQAVIKNALAFTERLPGIETLTFSDGTPFASDDTRQWLDECRAQASGGQATDTFSLAQQQAQAAANDGHHDQAMQVYQTLIAGSRSARDQFRARIALIELFLAVRGDADPMPMAQPLIDDCLSFQLAQWEPDLAGMAWQTVLKACRQALAQPGISTEPAQREACLRIQQHALQQLARIDFPAASRQAP